MAPKPLHLTFDDGPDPLWTPAVLGALAQLEARATFFVLGAQVQAHPELVDAILRGGHRVELHGHAHLDHRVVPEQHLIDDTDEALEVLLEVGCVPEWWRLPWGRPGPASAAIARSHGLEIVGWDADTHDWRGDAWAQQPRQVRAVAERGGIVLLHDGFGPGARRTSAENTLELIGEFGRLAAHHRTPLQALPAAEMRV